MRIGIAPYTGARLQYITVAEAASISFSCGNRGVLRIFCNRGPSLLDPEGFPSLTPTIDAELELDVFRFTPDMASVDERPSVRILGGFLDPGLRLPEPEPELGGGLKVEVEADAGFPLPPK